MLCALNNEWSARIQVIPFIHTSPLKIVIVVILFEFFPFRLHDFNMQFLSWHTFIHVRSLTILVRCSLMNLIWSYYVWLRKIPNLLQYVFPHHHNYYHNVCSNTIVDCIYVNKAPRNIICWNKSISKIPCGINIPSKTIASKRSNNLEIWSKLQMLMTLICFLNLMYTP
mgnify:CR=1 FL=1